MALSQPHSHPIVHLLLQLPSLQHTPHNHEQVVMTLKAIIREQPHFLHFHLTQLGQYFRSNLENNLSILPSLQCLVVLHPQLPHRIKRDITVMLEVKYQCTSFTEELEKLKSVNSDLIEPFLCLLGRLTEWFQLQIEEKQYKDVEVSKFVFLMEYAYSISRLEFQSGFCLEEGNVDYCLLMLHHLLTQDQRLLTNFLKDNRLICKLATTIFYFLGSYSLEEIEHVSMMFHCISKMMSLFLFQNIFFKQTVLEYLLPQLRLKGLGLSHDQALLVERIQSSVTAVLTIRWSLQAEYEWTSLCWILWDMLEVQPTKQSQLLSELICNAKGLLKYIQLS